MLHVDLLGSGRFCAIVLFSLALNTAALAQSDDDIPAPHRHAEAHRKALQAARAQDALARATTDPNQLRWDVRFIDLDLSFDESTESVSGNVGFRITVVDGPINSVVLDLDDALTVSAVGGSAIGFSHALDRLSINLDQSYANGASLSFDVTYSGTPNQGIGSFGVETVDGQRLIWSLSEPFGARSWWPCKDAPEDKADSASIKFTVPSNMIAVSNGTLENVVDFGTTKRYEWFERYPITTYLISIAAYPYTEQTVQWQPAVGEPMPVTVWSWPSQAGAALTAANSTLSMLSVFESRFGPYPFVDEKYGQAQFTWGGGMEHQTATSLCCWTSSGLIAHELAHQWFGDHITCADFTQIWLNEGFATYSEALWREANEGPAAYLDEMMAARYLGDGTILVPEDQLDDFGRVFSGDLTYNKASWVLHMLRGILGDTDFFNFLKAYTADPNVSYGVATTDDVRRVAEQVSGLNLTGFFHQWIEVPWYPTFALEWNAQPSGGGSLLDVELRQLQSHYIFETPITLRVVLADATSTDYVIDVDQAIELFNTVTGAEVVDVILDPDDWVLHAVEEEVKQPTFNRGILLVNGVDWQTYSATILPAYEDSTFTGDQPFDFWDALPNSSSGYPAQLPSPRGIGAIPESILGEYSAVVWVGNDYLGDLDPWLDTAMLSYLEKGGNLLLMTRRGRNFLTQPRQDYLGTSFSSEVYEVVGDATAVLPGLVTMAATGTQSIVSPLSPSYSQPETVNLFDDASDPSRSLGAWRHPTGGGSVRSAGGHFVHLAGRPYRWDRVALRQNTEFILTQLMNEPLGPVSTNNTPSIRTRLRRPIPNPFNPRVEIRFSLSSDARSRIEIFDARGRRVRMLLDEELPAGDGARIWDGRDDTGVLVASGVYNVLLHAAGTVDRTKVTLVR